MVAADERPTAASPVVHNVCRHRAGPLVDDGAGSCRALVCRYHGWSYELDGGLRSARGSGIPHADLDGVGLLEVKVATWRGLLFVGLDPDLPSIEEWLGDGFVAQCEGFPIDTWRPTDRRTHLIACNWKAYGDNYLEGYHIPFVHPQLARSIDTTTYAVTVHDGWARHSATTRDGAVATGAWLYHWPNLALNVYEHGMSIERWFPDGPTSCLLVLDFCFAEADDAGEARNQLDIEASELICTEDKVICEAVQRNLSAGAYTDGLLAPRHEAGVTDFQRRVVKAREASAGAR